MNIEIYKASAGSGKTYTLVKEYVKKLIKNKGLNPHKSLLAITFTNKASAEMKSRIISTLFEFSSLDLSKSYKSALFRDISIELDLEKNELSSISKRILTQIIHQYSFFSVSTIDKFIYKIIKGFSYELELPSNVQVETDKDKIILEGINSLIDQVGLDHDLTRNLISFSNHKTQDDKSWDIQSDLLNFANELFKEHKFIFLSQKVDLSKLTTLQKKLKKEINSFEQSILINQKKIEKLISSILPEAFTYRSLPNYVKKIKTIPLKDIEISTSKNKRIHDSLNNSTWFKKSAEQIEINSIENITPQINQIISKIKYITDNNYAKYQFNRACYDSFFLVSILGKIDKKIQAIKNDNSIIHISEFNQIIFNFLRKNTVPFIYEKIGTRFLNYFIDEFQDTSVIQWRNLLPLIGEGLSTGGSCMLVGDGKQSIYRWRGGDVTQFINLCDSKNSNVKILDTNYRSASEIVKFNNRFFSHLGQSLVGDKQRLYNNLSQKVSKNSHGFLEISLLDSEGVELDQQTLELTLNKIQNCLERGHNYSDITILTRSNNEITKLATYLSEKNVPIISSESLLLKNSLTVQFLVANLKILLNQYDQVSKTHCLEFLLKNEIISQNKISNHEFININSKLNNKDFTKLINSFGFDYDLDVFKNINLYEFIESIVRIFDLQSEPNLYINFFLDLVYDFGNSNSSSVLDFVSFWNQKKDSTSVILPEGVNAVELMSIHKSKGLQFEVVIFPFANWKDDLGKDRVWFDVSDFFNDENKKYNVMSLLTVKKELESWPKPFPDYYAQHKQNVLLDNINMLYVAMTRPVSELYVISNKDRRRGNIYNLFHEYLNTAEKANYRNNIFKLGKLANISKTKITKNDLELEKIVSESWRPRVKIKKRHTVNKITKNKFSIVWGELVHDIMSKINSAQDIKTVLSEYKIEANYGNSSYNKLLQQIRSIFANEIISNIFDKSLEIYSESEILDPSGKIYRPDKVLVHKNNEVSLIDYKTGGEKNSHVKQMSNYEAVLVKMGYIKINKLLVYVSSGKIKQLS